MPHRTRGANKRNRGKWVDDPLVPISGEQLRKALRHSGLSLPELARKLGEARQTLDYIVRDATARCRRSRRAALARALGVSEEWLGEGGDDGMEWLLGRLANKRQSHQAINRLGRRCEKALQSDGGPVPNATGMILNLALPAHWRRILFQELPPELAECRDLSELELDIVQTALANALEAILLPWLTGKARLNYQALKRLGR